MGLFNQFTFETPENVELEFTLAGIGNRALALFIDYSVLAGIQIIYLLAILIFPDLIADIVNSVAGDIPNVEIWVYAILALIFFFTYLGYFLIFETLWQGQTPGKKFAKIRVIRDDGRPVRMQQATLRAILRPIDDLLSLGFFFIILGRQEKRIGDWVAGTLVIQEEMVTNKAEFSVTEAAKKLATQLKLDTDLSLLLPEDFAVIREYLKRRDEMILEARIDLARKLAEQAKEIIHLETVPPDVTPNLFLEALYLAYQK
jgi:uncharacterized RDD family membrane protein YckC